MANFPRSLLIGLTLALLVGCSNWSGKPTQISLLRPPRMSPDSVVLEIATVELRGSDEEFVEQFWKEVDEQHFATELRRRLADQGLRCGIVGAQLPAWVARRLEEQRRHLELDEKDGAAVLSDVAAQRRYQWRAHQRRAIPVGSVREALTLERPWAEGEAVPTYSDAQCHVGITVEPHGDGRVSLALVPEIHHGEVRQRWVAQRGSFRVDAKRDCCRLDDLEVPATLAPGQTLVLASTPEPRRVGGAFFSAPARDGGTRLLLVRLAQTQLDDLFSPQQPFTPIATLPQ
jgi:hypothetical protein